MPGKMARSPDRTSFGTAGTFQSSSGECRIRSIRLKIKNSEVVELLRSLALRWLYTHKPVFRFSIPYCASHAAPHMGMHRQADEACPRAVHKTGTYRSLRFF